MAVEACGGRRSGPYGTIFSVEFSEGVTVEMLCIMFCVGAPECETV